MSESYIFDVQFSDSPNYISSYEDDMWNMNDEDYDTEYDEDETETIESLKLQMKLQSIVYDLAIKILEKIIDLYEVFLFEYIMLTIFLAAVILAFIFYHICIINSNKNNINHLNEFLVKDHSRTRLSEIPSIKIINQGCARNVAPTEKKKDDKNKGCKSNIPSKSKSTDNKMKEISSVSDTIQFMYS